MPKAQSAESLMENVRFDGCCGLNCINCPADPPWEEGVMKIDKTWIIFAHTHPEISRAKYETMKNSLQPPSPQDP